MSQYIIPAEATLDPLHEITVGWDQSMLTYFFQVRNRAAQEHNTRKSEEHHAFVEAGGLSEDFDHDYREEMIVWAGDQLRAIYDIEDLQREIRPYATLPPDLLSTLYMDRDEGR